MKPCARCHAEKPLSEFRTSTRSRDGGTKVASYCKACMTQYAREWRKRNPAAQRLAKKKWELAHPEEVRAARRRRYQADLERSRLRNREYRNRNPEITKARNLAYRERGRLYGRDGIYRHGLTLDEVNMLIAAQDGKCAICEIELGPKRAVDHDHATGVIRGILCYKCNGALGWYETRTERVVAYQAQPPAVAALGERIYRRSPFRKDRKVMPAPLRGRTVRQTHCKRGHPLTGENCYTRKDGLRSCRTCTVLRNRARWRAAHPDAPERLYSRKF